VGPLSSIIYGVAYTLTTETILPSDSAGTQLISLIFIYDYSLNENH